MIYYTSADSCFSWKSVRDRHSPCALTREAYAPLWISMELLLSRLEVHSKFLPRDAMHKRGLSACSVCQCVCLSVTFVSCAKTNKDIFEICSPSGSQAILVFPYQAGWRHSDGNPPKGGIECKGYMKKWRFSTNISLYLRNGYSQMGTCSMTICKHRILFPSIQHLAWLPQGCLQGKQK